MKNLLFLLFAFFVLSSLRSQQWDWTKTPGGSISNVCTDGTGNLFATGGYLNPISFGDTTLINSDSSNFFIVKYDNGGNVIWVKNIGGQRSTSIAASSDGNLYVTGIFSRDTIKIGSTTLVNAGGSNPGSAGNGPGDPCMDIFIAKLDANGNALWARRSGGTGNDWARSISADPNGNIFVTGFFESSTITFGSITLTKSDPFEYARDLFIVKYDSNGNAIWAQSEEEDGNCVSTDAVGNVFLTRYFSPANITKYDPNGNILWTKNAVGNSEGASVSADVSGNVFFAGGFNSTAVSFDSITLAGNGQGTNLFLVKYDGDGKVLWAKTSDGTSGYHDYCHSVSADADGGAFVTGYFEANTPLITFDSISLTAPPTNCSPYCFPVFIVRYDANGNTICASALADGGAGYTSVSADPFGNAYIGSEFYVTPFIVGTDTLSSTGTFIGKYSCNNNIGMNELINEGSILVYPNPSSSKLTIKSSEKFSSLVVRNLLGENVFQQPINELGTFNYITVNLPTLSKGIYFIDAHCGSKRISKKIIIE